MAHDRTTINDIARLAGVSKATVSRAIHSPHLVKNRTLQRIHELIENNDYVYDATAGDLSRRRSSIIGIIIPTIRSSIFSDSTYVIQEAAKDCGLTTVIGNTNYDERSAISLLKLFQERRVAGLILTGLSDQERPLVERLIKQGTPCVVTWEVLTDTPISYVGFDNHKATEMVTNYLLDLNHRRIGLLTGPYSKVKRIRPRINGYCAALQSQSIEFDPDLVIETDFSLTDGKEAMRRLLSLPDPPSAVFAASDVLAMGALAAIKEKGLKVPDDLSLIGLGNIDFASYCDPPLTTVNFPTTELGRLALKVLQEIMDRGPGHVRQYCLDANLIIRNSCQPFTAN